MLRVARVACVRSAIRCGEQRLRDHFQANGSEVTDVRIMRTKDGRSRMFGFVGFRTPEEADIGLASRGVCKVLEAAPLPEV